MSLALQREFERVIEMALEKEAANSSYIKLTYDSDNFYIQFKEVIKHDSPFVVLFTDEQSNR